MSAKTVIQLRLSRQTCRECGERPARFSFHGIVKRDPQHDLCFQCFRSANERRRAAELATRKA
jgi:hypothetical protein